MPPDVEPDRFVSESMSRTLADYERHLSSERDLSAHTVRAYLGDITGLLEHATLLGHVDVSSLDLRTLRSWLAKQQTLGRSRTTMGRRGTAARVFTAWLVRTGRLERDAGALLASPKAHKPLPAVLNGEEARLLIDVASQLADDGSPVGLRDVAMLELLYATGIRVGELCGLDVDDVDSRAQRDPRPRQGPQGTNRPVRHPGRSGPAALAGPGPTAGSGPSRAERHSSSARVARGSTREQSGAWCTGASLTCRALPTSDRTGFDTPPPPTFSRAAQTCAASRSCWATPRWRRPSSTHM